MSSKKDCPQEQGGFTNIQIDMADLIYKKLSYILNGIAFQIDNTLGYGSREKVYGDAFETLLKSKKIHFQREVKHNITIEGKIVSKRCFDFLIDDKIIIEIKVGDYGYRESYHQVLEYLKPSGIKLGMIIRFAPNGVRIKRIINY